MSENRQTPQSDEELGPPKADFGAPPPYELTNSMPTHAPHQLHASTAMNAQQIQQMQLQQVHQHQLQMQQQQQQNAIDDQLYQHHQQQQQQQQQRQPHGKLPTYEEVQLEKSLNGELPPSFLTLPPPPPMIPQMPPPNPLIANLCAENGGPNANVGPANGPNGTSPALTFIAIDASDAENLANTDNSLLGTDIMFITAFMAAFLFNWIGFLVLTCFCHTIAARYGALSGFGLSLAKWTLIVKNSTEFASHENSWLWWLIMAFGFLICVRALIQYVSIKRTWRLLSTSAQERLLFLY